MSGKIPPLPLLRAGKVYTCGEEGNGKRVWEREDVETARLCFNWSQQVQLGVEVTYRINKKKKGSHSRCRLVPFPLKRLETDCFMLKRILNYLSAPSWLASKSNAPKRWRNEARITSLSHSSRRLSSPCLAPCRPASLIPNLLRAHTCVWLGGWARRRRVHPTNSAASAAQDWETSAGICGAIFPGMLHPLNPSTERKIPQKSQMGKKKRKKPPSTLFAWAGNEPRMPVFAYGGESRVHLRLQSHQRRFPPFLKEGTAVTAKPGRHPKGTEIPSCLKPSLLKRTRLII